MKEKEKVDGPTAALLETEVRIYILLGLPMKEWN